MKKILVLAVATLSLSFYGFAQKHAVKQTKEVAVQNSNPEAAIESNAANATQKLEKLVGSLTTEQRNQIQEVNLGCERRKQIVTQSNEPEKDKLLQQIESNRNRRYLEILQGKQAEKFQKTMSK
jgi:uncharacterized protein HemX